jgi:hypothetical protein
LPVAKLQAADGKGGIARFGRDARDGLLARGSESWSKTLRVLPWSFATVPLFLKTGWGLFVAKLQAFVQGQSPCGGAFWA